MNRLYYSLFFLIIFLALSLKTVNADSSYVLPYPSFMPGHTLYKIDLLKDEILRYWYFGSFGQFKYNLKQTDKYLVEAKTLFEYKQYLLAVYALEKSDLYYNKLLHNLLNARKEKKDISQSLTIFKNASLKHVEILEKIKNEIPENFVWLPEKKRPTELNLKEIFNESISIRQKDL